MAAATTSVLSHRQQALLAAMGYTLYGRRTAGASSQVVPSTETRQHPRVAADQPTAAPPAEMRHFALMRAVLRVVDRDPGPDAVLVDSTWRELGLPAPESVLGAADKRALWPRLRRLRRARNLPG